MSFDLIVVTMLRFTFMLAMWTATAFPSATATTTVFPPAAPESQGISAEALDELADFVEAYVDEDRIVGTELLVVKNRRAVLHETFGWLDREAKRPMVKDTLFNLRSMTKPVTGAAIQILIDEGKIAPDDLVSRFIPAFSKGKTATITVRQLLEHRGGLPMTILTGLDEYPDLQSMADAVAKRGPEFDPASKFWYSDAGTDVLAAIVEKASGRPVDEFVRERLLEPLGMSDSYYPKDAADPRWKRIASLYGGGPRQWARIWRPETKPFYPFAWGSQSLYGTPMDYARFLAMWMDGGTAGDRRVLSPEAIARTLTPASRMSQLGSDEAFPTHFSNVQAWYGQMSVLHVDLDEPKRAVIIGHSGSDGTIAWAWPERDLMILFFTQSRGQISAITLEARIDALLLHPGAKAPKAMPDAMSAFLGSYTADSGPYRNLEMKVAWRNEHLTLDIPGRPLFELGEPDDKGRRPVLIAPHITVAFVRDDKNEVTALELRPQPDVTFVIPRGTATPVKPLTVEEMQPYLGFFHDPDAGVDVEMAIQDGRLVALHPAVPVDLVFSFPDDEGFWSLQLNPEIRVRFNRDEEGRVISYTAYSQGQESVKMRVEPEDNPKDDGGSGDDGDDSRSR